MSCGPFARPGPRRICSRGLVAKQRGATDQAIEAYNNAIRLGDRRIEVYEQLIELLYAERRFAEAEEYLGQLQEQVPLSESLSTLEISLATQAGHLDRALAAARRGARSAPRTRWRKSGWAKSCW